MDIIARTVRAGYGKIPGWLPGDTIPRTLSGTVDLCNSAGDVVDVTGQYYDVLLAIDHNPQFEGAHNAQFGLAWYGDDKAPITFVGENFSTFDGDNGFTMWPAEQGALPTYGNSRMRRCAQNFLGTITDAILRKAIVSMPKYVDDAYLSAVSNPASIAVYRDAIWIPSVRELSLDADVPEGELAVVHAFLPFASAATRTAYPHNSRAITVHWAVRTRRVNSNWWQNVNGSGWFTGASPNYKVGIRPCYTIA